MTTESSVVVLLATMLPLKVAGYEVAASTDGLTLTVIGPPLVLPCVAFSSSQLLPSLVWACSV